MKLIIVSAVITSQKAATEMHICGTNSPDGPEFPTFMSIGGDVLLSHPAAVESVFLEEGDHFGQNTRTVHRKMLATGLKYNSW